MNKIAVAVCDTDREYRDRFVTYLVERKAEEYAVSAFSMPEKLLEALEEKKPDLAHASRTAPTLGWKRVANG